MYVGVPILRGMRQKGVGGESLLRLDRLGSWRSRFFRLFGRGLHAVAEGADAFAETLSQFRKLLGAKNEQRDHQDNEQVTRLQQSFKHKGSPCGAAEPFPQS